LSLIYFAIDQNFICILVCLDLNEKIWGSISLRYSFCGA
jgi:hypothetical protein